MFSSRKVIAILLLLLGICVCSCSTASEQKKPGTKGNNKQDSVLLKDASNRDNSGNRSGKSGSNKSDVKGKNKQDSVLLKDASNRDSSDSRSGKSGSNKSDVKGKNKQDSVLLKDASNRDSSDSRSGKSGSNKSDVEGKDKQDSVLLKDASNSDSSGNRSRKSGSKKISQSELNKEEDASCLSASNRNQILLYVSLGLNVLSLILIIVLFVKPYFGGRRRRETDGKGNVLANMNEKLKELKEDLLKHENGVGKQIDDVVKKRVEERFSRLHEKEQRQKKVVPEPKQDPIIEKSKAPEVLYASQANASSNTFYEVKTAPDDSTIYELKLIGSDEAEFSTYVGAKEKILGAPGNLECAANDDISQGGQDVVTSMPGKAKRMADGRWEITQKAKIKFE